MIQKRRNIYIGETFKSKELLSRTKPNRQTIFFLVIINKVLPYEWPESDSKYDCIVSISIGKKPACVGVFISTQIVLTSANPFNDIGDNISAVEVHVVDGAYDKTKAISVAKIEHNHSYRKKCWIPMGVQGTKHSCIHDIALITTSVAIQENPGGNKHLRQSDRKPFPSKLVNETSNLVPTNWVFAGFGYLDKEHLDNSSILELSSSSELLANCDEWFPREWGRFICMLDDQNLYGLPSGAPLFEFGDTSTVYGVGSFSLKKGKENLLVFTDMLPYIGKLSGFDEKKTLKNDTDTK
ncbi:hypothetical protein KGM_205311 [Danaus plexippus plexippus]|uniref:Peptidase S1 domain-containing protein n=1 Tax=Danaus plexippus plexippus TaxID=278856 RepID=A0A212FG09_DANPL|nr:hypothetical protein KGM_205311 [Danaus plexippus plexippus]